MQGYPCLLVGVQGHTWLIVSVRGHICFIVGVHGHTCTLKTGISVEDVDPILKLLQGVSRPETQLGVAIHSEPPLSFLILMEFAFQVRSKLLTFSLRRLSTSSFILNFLECSNQIDRNESHWCTWCLTIDTAWILLLLHNTSWAEILQESSRKPITEISALIKRKNCWKLPSESGDFA